MRTPLVVTPFTNDALDVLKVGALYLDKVRIPRPRLYEVTPKVPGKMKQGDLGIITGIVEFVDEGLLKDIQLLLDEGLVELEELDETNHLPGERDRLATVFSQNLDLLVEESDTEYDDAGRPVSVQLRFRNEEVAKVHEKHVGPLTMGKRVDWGFIYEYYNTLFNLAGAAIGSGNPVLSGSTPLRDFLSYAYSSAALDRPRIKRLFPEVVETQFVADVVQAALLDVSSLSFDDILEARLALSTELEAFRNTMSSLHFELTHEFGAEELLREGQKVAAMRLRPKLSDLERKIAESRHGILKDLLTLAKKPDAYVPLLGAGFLGLPPVLALAISAGIITAEAALEWKRRSSEIQGNGLFYLVELRRRLKPLG